MPTGKPSNPSLERMPKARAPLSSWSLGAMSTSFRHSAGFGKHIEYWIVGPMLKEGVDGCLPPIDDDAIDAVIKRPDGTFIEVQIKARSHNVILGDGALFAAITHELRKNYSFVFFSERHATMWIMSSEEFIAAAVQNTTNSSSSISISRAPESTSAPITSPRRLTSKTGKTPC